jgi:hypothetical protein
LDLGGESVDEVKEDIAESIHSYTSVAACMLARKKEEQLIWGLKRT